MKFRALKFCMVLNSISLSFYILYSVVIKSMKVQYFTNIKLFSNLIIMITFITLNLNPLIFRN